MRKDSWLCLLAFASTVPALWAQQDVKKLTARELFYAAIEDSQPAPAAPKSPKKPAPVKAKVEKRKSTPPSGTPVEARNTQRPSAPDEGVPIIRAAYKAHPLGVRYTILKKAGNDAVEVDSDAVFHAGDRIRLLVESNEDGYLYVVNRGSSGTWKLLFPAAEIKGGDNRIQPRTKYEIPSGYTFTFDEQPGMEKLFVVLSREPEPDLEKLIYSLGQGGSPVKTPSGGGDKPKVLMASAAFSDATIDRLRTAYARDLIIEKVDDDQPGPKKEKAVYTVNPTGGTDARVIADITLRHE